MHERPRLLALHTSLEIATLFIAVLLTGAAHLQLLSAKWGVASVSLMVIWAVWRVRHQAASILCVFLAVLLLGAVVTPPRLKLWDTPAGLDRIDALVERWERSGTFERDLPIVLHLVFDELTSPGAIPDMRGSEQIRANFYRLAREDGFRVYDSVFARDFYSAISLPNVFGPEYLGLSEPDDIAVEEVAGVRDNEYFREFERRGYHTAVFQTAHVDFCADASVDLCETFDSFDPDSSSDDTKDLRTRVIERAHTMLRAYEPSHVSALGAVVLGKLSMLKLGTAGVLGVAGRYDVQGFPGWFDRFSAFAATVPRGSHIFAHFLVPHSPYLLTSDCRIDGRYDSGYYLALRFEAGDREARREAYYAEYLQQLGCVQTKLDQLLDALSGLDQYRDAIIVIHGDHGSRISNGNVLEDLDTRDLVDNYGTFFAVRGPGIDPGIDCTFVSLGEVFREYFAPGSSARTSGEPLPVLITSREASDNKVEVPMPRFGCATDDH